MQPPLKGGQKGVVCNPIQMGIGQEFVSTFYRGSFKGFANLPNRGSFMVPDGLCTQTHTHIFTLLSFLLLIWVIYEASIKVALQSPCPEGASQRLLELDTKMALRDIVHRHMHIVDFVPTDIQGAPQRPKELCETPFTQGLHKALPLWGWGWEINMVKECFFLGTV